MTKKFKKKLRKQVSQKLAGISPKEASSASIAAAELLAGMDEFRKAEVVMLYLSIHGEIDCLPIAQLAWSMDKKVLAPTACHNCRLMRPILCHPDDEEMFHNHHGLRQPAWREMEMEIEKIDLLIVPGLAFDRNRNRLGRGGGYYDRFLAREGLRARKIGLAFEAQIVETVPVGPNDLPVDLLVTNKEIIR